MTLRARNAKLAIVKPATVVASARLDTLRVLDGRSPREFSVWCWSGFLCIVMN
jgi:hypothetical protein